MLLCLRVRFVFFDRIFDISSCIMAYMEEIGVFFSEGLIQRDRQRDEKRNFLFAR